jgi:hypothetical protein
MLDRLAEWIETEAAGCTGRDVYVRMTDRRAVWLDAPT